MAMSNYPFNDTCDPHEWDYFSQQYLGEIKHQNPIDELAGAGQLRGVRGDSEQLRYFAQAIKHELESQRYKDQIHDDRLLAIERRLFILDRNVVLEDEFEELVGAYKEYKRVEEKFLTFKTLQGK